MKLFYKHTKIVKNKYGIAMLSIVQSGNLRRNSNNMQWGITYLLTYLAIITCYRSWPQLICDAIHHKLLQLGANFGYPTFLDSYPPVWPKTGEAVLVCDFYHLTQNRRLNELGCSYPYEEHDPTIEYAVF